VGKNRVDSGRLAIRRFGCDILLLDDGFQYHKFPHKSTRDIVLIDANNPFGNGHCLPRGILREPAKNISRAKYICITKVGGRDTTALREKIKRLNPDAEIMECDHAPACLVDAFTRERHDLGKLRGMKALALSGIASPKNFEDTLRDLGVDIIETRRHADHHRYTEQETLDTVNAAKTFGCDAVITTEKDAVRMTLHTSPPVPVYYLRIEVKFRDGESTFRNFVHNIISP
ncbi:MAG: tetraacyldisaccharide 4'-kinase, partial [Kiritimatiellaeota bacterium]|nr:tetraacyldisaccharide 4'-kinase [Kiritimatiellota bacterium]